MKTPYFVIHKQQLDDSIAQLNSAIEHWWPKTIAGYSFKTNSLPWVIRYMKSCGFRAEVVSDDEYELARRCGYVPNEIIYNGIAKSKETFCEALTGGSIVNLDSEREIRWVCEMPANQTYKVGLRVNFDLEQMCPGQTQCGTDGGRFGFCYENGQLKHAIDRLNAKDNILISGLHLHCSSKTRSLDIYQAIAQMACIIAEEYQLNLEYVDIGGGFFGGLSDRPGFFQYLQAVEEILSKTFDKNEVTLIVEPGMSVIGAPISYVTSVVDVKETAYNCFVVTDGGRTHIDPFLHKLSYFSEVNFNGGTADRPLLDKQIISGFTCMENDRLFELKLSPMLKEGDQIIYRKVGAYTINLASQFIKFFPDVYLEEQGTMKKIQERWTAVQLLRGGAE